MSDVVGVWEVPLSDKVHKVEFEHGTTTGKRVIKVDGEEVIRHDWMFKLVGRETFEVSGSKCEVVISAASGFSYEYTLLVDGKQLKKFKERQSKIMKTWLITYKDNSFRVVLGDSDENVFIKTQSSGNKKAGIIYTLVVDGKEATENGE
ncbi:Fas apoptotic inhibitory molecule-like protein [Leptotrombidium deliense]|uniref:Fas apoptotic inhibitory molecule-like protein n=1 Tax=Leptotrombidium deliense TaxID=299467 RepID=A0A443SU85_9ACAR|nr:Fas apoptotic inhibitory molecule-like protein [Leptotrombidium deliense]